MAVVLYDHLTGIKLICYGENKTRPTTYDLS